MTVRAARAAVTASRATGLLRAFNEAGVLHAADVHVGRRLGALGGEPDERVLLAAALCVRGVRHGSVVLRLADVPGTVTADETADESDAVAVADSAPRPLPALPAWPEPAAWRAAVGRSPLVAAAGDGPAPAPLHWEDGALWLDRYWRQEVAVADDLLRRASATPEVDRARLRAALARLWPGQQPDDQRLAAAVCVLSRVAVLGGGPGTGKTTTVARLLAALRQTVDGGRPARPPRVALAAPTGKAAVRLQDAVRAAAERDTHLEPADRALLGSLTASTLQRLLGARGRTGRFRHGADNRLPHDVVVVDEASMVSLPLFAHLLAALRPTTRLVLVGDPDQLASVEAGAVLADLVAPARAGERTAPLAAALREVVPYDAQRADGAPAFPAAAGTASARVRDGVVLLRTVRRFAAGGPLAELAGAVRDGDPDRTLAVLRRGHPDVRFEEVPDDGPVTGRVLDALRADAVRDAADLVAAARSGDAGTALAVLERHRLLCGHRRGPRGVAHWTGLVHRWVVEEVGVEPRRDGRYPGLPLLVTANDLDNRLYNGDTGVVLARGHDLVAVFGRGDGPFEVPLGRLSDVRPMHAMTVHRSQGSQFSRVTVLLPPASSPLGTRETLYTAVTRAADGVRVVGSAEAVRAAVTRPAARATGLRRRLA